MTNIEMAEARSNTIFLLLVPEAALSLRLTLTTEGLKIVRKPQCISCLSTPDEHNPLHFIFKWLCRKGQVLFASWEIKNQEFSYLPTFPWTVNKIHGNKDCAGFTESTVQRLQQQPRPRSPHPGTMQIRHQPLPTELSPNYTRINWSCRTTATAPVIPVILLWRVKTKSDIRPRAATGISVQ